MPRASPIVLRIKLRYDDVEVMVQRFAPNVGKSGLFLPTRSLQPLGAELKFELRLADDTPALVGLGRVKAVTAPDPGDPKAAFGMAIELMRVTQQSRALILRMLERRRELGLPELGLPTASDIDAARAASTTAAAGEPERAALPSTPTIAVAPPPIVAPPIVEPPIEALLTAPRSTGPLGAASVLAVAPLPPEPARRKRVAVGELIETASGPVAASALALPGLDDDVDIGAAIARARALAAGTLDAELEALSAPLAAPIEISVEAASAELARQLGGSAVRGDRSARWLTPPATSTVAPPVASPVMSTVTMPVALPPDDASLSTDDDDDDDDPPGRGAEPYRDRRLELTEPLPLVVPELEIVDDTREAMAGKDARGGDGNDEIQQLDEFDLEEAEHTELGDAPVGATPFYGYGASPSAIDQVTLAARLEAQLAEAEAEAEADDLGLVAALGLAADGELAAADPHDPAHDLSLEEIDDFEILSEADADDALAAGAVHDAPGVPDGADDERRASSVSGESAADSSPGNADFAAHLDLGDSDRYIAMQPTELPGRLYEAESRDPHHDSAGHALAAFEHDDPERDARVPATPRHGVEPIFEPEPSNSFTLASAPPAPLDLDPPRPRPISMPQPAPPRAASRLTDSPSLYDSPVEDFELEHALEALDVDLDDLSIPHAEADQSIDLAPARARAASQFRTAQLPALASGTPALHELHAAAPGTGRILARSPINDDLAIELEEDDEPD